MPHSVESFPLPEGGQYCVCPKGIEYRDRHYQLLIPWARIAADCPVNEAGDAIAVDLRVSGGEAIHVLKSPDQVEGSHSDCPIAVRDFSLLLLGCPSSHRALFRSAANRERQRYLEHVEMPLSSGSPSCSIRKEEAGLTVAAGSRLYFPQFCPISGGPVDQIVEYAPGRRILVSMEGMRQLYRNRRWRHAIPWAVLCVQVLCGWGWMVAKQPVVFPCTAYGWSALLYLAVPMAHLLWRDRLVVQELNGRHWIWSADSEWMQSMWELNSASYPKPVG